MATLHYTACSNLEVVFLNILNTTKTLSPHGKIATVNSAKIIIEKELGAFPTVDEMEVVDILVINKFPKASVKFLKPSRIDKTPDILIDDTPWEIKSPKSNGSRTIEHAVRSASKQSENIVIDLRESKLNTNRAVAQIKFHSVKRTNIRRLIVVTKAQALLDIK